MLFVATWLVLEIKIVSEVNHTEKDKSHMESLYVESKRNEIIDLIYKTKTDSQK